MTCLPNPGFDVDADHTGFVVVDPQNDFLHPEGAAWDLLGTSVAENNTIENIERLLKLCKHNGIPVFVSPHYYFPTDIGWEFEGAMMRLMHDSGVCQCQGLFGGNGFQGSGADWLERYKPFIEDGDTIIANPHKVCGPESSDLILQLRKRRINKVVLAGMSANLCVESHLRELVEQGFEVAVVKDATAGVKVPEGDGYASALVNFRFIASAVMTTGEVEKMVQGMLMTKGCAVG